MGIHERQEHASAVGRELQAACDLVGEHRACLLVVAGVGSLADIMKKDGEIEDGWILELLKNLPVAGEFFFSGKENAVQFLDTDERVLIRRVAVVELVLDKTIKRSELRDVATKNSQIVHQAECAPDLSLPGQDGKKCLPCGDGVLKGAIDEVQSTADEIHKLGVELKLPNLRMVEGPHETVGVVVENIPRLGFDAAVANNETVELLGFLADTKEAENALRACDRPGLHFLEGVFRHEINRSGMAIVVAHEGLDLAENIFLGVAEFIGDAALELKRQDIGRASVDVLHGGAGAQHEVVAFFEAAPVSVAEDFGFDELGCGVDAQLELGNPEQALVIAKPAGATLDVRLLHEDRAAVFFAQLGLVGEAPCDVLIGPTAHALLLKPFFEAIENLALAGQQTAIEHRCFGDRILVAFFHSLGDRARRVPDLEADIPKSDECLADDLLHLFINSAFVLQKEDIHIAHGSEFAAAIATEGHHRKTACEGFCCNAAHDILEKLAEENIHHIRSLARDLASPTPGVVPGAQAQLLLLAEVFKEGDRVAVSRAGTLGELQSGFFKGVRFRRLTHGAGGRMTISTRRLICCSSIEPVAGATRRDSPKPRVSMESAGMPMEEINHSFTVSARSSLRRRL